MLMLSIFSVNSSGQNQDFKSLGNHLQHDWDGQRLEISTTEGKMRITPYSSHVIRIQVVQNSFEKDFSYAVIQSAEKIAVSFVENRGFFELSTDDLTLVISLQPVRISFYNKNGVLLNQDDPAFGTSWQGTQVTAYKSLQPNEKFIGLGAKTGGLNRFGSAYVNWNTDNPHYENYSDPLYTSIPFYMGIVNNAVYGIFFDNSWRTQFNFGASNDRFSYFSADGGEMDYFFIQGEGVAEIIQFYGNLTGKMPLPPLWSLGYQQSRWSYTPDKEVLTVARTLREKEIPADVMVLDIDFMDAYKIFTWHPDNFSNPKGFLDQLKAMNFHTTVIVDPGIKVEKGYHAYEDGLKKRVFALYPDGTPYTGQVWPGWCHFPDFTSEIGRSWWGDKFEGYVGLGIDGFWNDMNEIATWGQQVPSLVTFNWEGRRASYLEAKNVYGMQMARATFEGTIALMKGKRPFVLSRAGFSGSQRYTALWTGDNQAHDEHMLLGVRLVNSLGLSGFAFTGFDVGGFGGDANPALYSRWISIGAFTPFFRGHTAKNTSRSEPWSYGENPEAIAKKFISFRYHLMPYIYSAFKDAATTGLPVQRSLAVHYFADEKIFFPDYENQYLFGTSLLIAPVSSEQLAAKVYLPQGGWYDLYNDNFFNGNTEIWHPAPLDRLPVFVKAGSIIPLQSLVQNTTENPSDTLEVHVYKGSDSSSFLFYEDDGLTYAFENGSFYQRQFQFLNNKNQIILGKPEGSMSSKFKTLHFVMHGFEGALTKLSVNGKTKSLIKPEVTYLQTITKELKAEQTLQFILDNSDQQIIINW